MSEDRIIEVASEGHTFRYYQSESGKRYSHYDCERRLKSAQEVMYRWFSRVLKTRTTADDIDQSRYEIMRMRWVAQEISQYAEVIQRELDRLEGVDRKAERIKALRSLEGRTPEEAAAFLAKADQLEGPP